MSQEAVVNWAKSRRDRLRFRTGVSISFRSASPTSSRTASPLSQSPGVGVAPADVLRLQQMCWISSGLQNVAAGLVLTCVSSLRRGDWLVYVRQDQTTMNEDVSKVATMRTEAISRSRRESQAERSSPGPTRAAVASGVGRSPPHDNRGGSIRLFCRRVHGLQIVLIPSGKCLVPRAAVSRCDGALPLGVAR